MYVINYLASGHIGGLINYTESASWAEGSYALHVSFAAQRLTSYPQCSGASCRVTSNHGG